jgi:DNA-directed RNA polymerase subunit K/omega
MAAYVPGSFGKQTRGNLNSELCKRALEKVGNPNVLVNLVSRRVRQLNGTGGASPSRPLLIETAGLGMADIALIEIAEGKLGWEMLEKMGGEHPPEKPSRKRSSSADK